MFIGCSVFCATAFFLSEKTVSFVNSTDYLNNINN